MCRTEVGETAISEVDEIGPGTLANGRLDVAGLSKSANRVRNSFRSIATASLITQSQY